MKNTLFADPATELKFIFSDFRPTRLLELPELAQLAKVGRVFIKAEWERPLGNFKSLGGMVAGLRALARAASVDSLQELIGGRGQQNCLPRLLCASDGNHGLAVTAAAIRAGTAASVYLPANAGRLRARRIRELGGEVVRVCGTYDDAVRDAAAAAARGEGLLIADTSSDPADRVVRDVMAGYSLLTDEITAQFRRESGARPSHLFVQAGVGGLAAAMAEGLRDLMQAPAKLLVVEPESAACVALALARGRPVRCFGDLHTSAEMLSCGLASAPALEILQHYATSPVLVDEAQLQTAVDTLRQIAGVHTTPSGAAGFAGLLRVAAQPTLRAAHRLGEESSVLLVVTEGAV